MRLASKWFLTWIFFSIPTAQAAIPTQQIIDVLNQDVPKLLAENEASGASVALVTDKGIVYQNSYGTLSKTDNTPVNNDTMFSVMSTSKMFTATGVMTEVQAGKLDLNKTVADYLPNFRIQSRFSGNATQQIKLVNLLNHTAGFAHETSVGNNYDAGDANTASFDAHVKSIQDTWLRFPPGYAYVYSNLGMDLAGYILQTVSKQPFADYEQQHVLKPLGMTRSTFDWDKIDKDNNVAVGTLVMGAPAPSYVPIVPSGGLYSSAGDIARYIQFQLNDGKVNGKQVLDADLVKQMRKIPFQLAGQVAGYGLGIASTMIAGERWHNHNGGGFGYNATVYWSQKHKFGFVILVNGFVDNTPEINAKIFSLVEGKPQPFDIDTTQQIPEFQQQQVPEYVKQYSGNYLGVIAGSEITVKDNDGIFGYQHDKKFYPLNYIGYNTFYSPDTKTHYQFIRAKDVSDMPYLLRVETGTIDAYNDGPNDKPGPNKPEWQKLVGKYHGEMFTNPDREEKISVKNGYLYFNNKRLQEFKPNLFVAPDGKVLTVKSDGKLIWDSGEKLTRRRGQV